MATYEEIHGKRVETFSSDPTLDSSYEGQVWFNSTSGTLKTVVASATWSSSTSMTTARTDMGGFGIQTANVCATGNIPPRTAVTEEYDGNGWTGGGTASQAGQYRAGFGTLTAGAIAGARTPAPAASNATEEYDGTTWTEVADMSTARYNGSGMGSLDGLIAGGSTSGTTGSVTTEEWTVPESISNLTITD